jgi:CheY-like chemotaxis protein
MSDLQKLQAAARGMRLLFVEDNDALRENAAKLFKKLFTHVDIAADGEEALRMFKQNSPDLLIADIKMPKMDSIELCKKIRTLAPDMQIIVMSAYDNKEYLVELIKLKISSFIKKPLTLTELVQALEETLKIVKKQKEEAFLHSQQEYVFNNQSSMVLMMNEDELLLANKEFLDFFEVQDLQEFKEKHKSVESNFVNEEGFLPPAEKIDWFDGLSENDKKLFNVKMEQKKNNPKHFALNVKRVSLKGESVLLTFDDVSDLKLYDKTQAKKKEPGEIQSNPIEFLEVLRRNGAKVHLHNYYKGLSITNDALVVEIADGKVLLKTNYLQQKAIQYEKKTLILSETFPNAILCEKMEKIVFKEQFVEFSELRFIQTSPVLRRTIRVVPEDEHKVTLFINGTIFRADVSIEDISMDAIKIKTNAMPAGLSLGTTVFVDLVLIMDKRPFSLNLEAILFRQNELKNSFSFVFTFMLKPEQKSELLKYITKRQMAIIREFKGIQHGRE